MPKLSSTAPSVPPCLSPESAPVWARLRNYIRHAQRRTLLVIRHDSPRLPRELPPLLAEESGRPLVTATVSDAEPDPMAAAIHAAPGGNFPAGCILTITGAEDLALKTDDGSRAALYEFARRLDMRRDQFLPEGGIVLVWANARVFDALAEHSLNFISRAAAVLTLAAGEQPVSDAVTQTSSFSYESRHTHYHIPTLPPNAPDELHAALVAFDELAAAEELHSQGGAKIAHALAKYDAARDLIEAGWEAAHRWAALNTGGNSGKTEGDPICSFARALVAAYPSAGTHVLNLRQHPQERIVWLEDQLTASLLIGDKGHEAAALGNLGLASAHLGDTRSAIPLFEQALAIARQIGDRRGEGNALGSLGISYKNLGNTEKAIGLYEQWLGITRDLGDRRGEGYALGNLGNFYRGLGDVQKAIECYEKALMITREIGDYHGEGSTLGGLGNAYFVLGDAHKAHEFYEQWLSIARRFGDRRSEGIALDSLGNTHAALGDARKALEFHEEALAVDREAGDPRAEGSALFNSALALNSLGNRPEAFNRAEAALRIYETIEDPNAAKVRAKLAEWRGK